MFNLDFFKNKKILITGHTGFKGSWLSKILIDSGALVTGYSLKPKTSPNLFEILTLEKKMNSIIGDVRNFGSVRKCIKETKPEIVIHLAAQPIVRESYKNPHYTYETNVMGTVNILESIRVVDSVFSFLNVTTDKVYLNNEFGNPFSEVDPLDGYDPYSNSKSCSELVTHSYNNSFFSKLNIPISTARSGNVIGGGDFSPDRIIPDCIRAAKNNEKILVRNPNSTRPYQHVLEPLFVYLLIIQKQSENIEYAGYYNVGPDEENCLSTRDLVELFCELWGEGLSWNFNLQEGPHEAGLLSLDCNKLKKKFNWKPNWGVSIALEKTIEWAKTFYANGEISMLMENQIDEYMNIFKN